VLGDRETHDRLVRELTIGTNAVFVFVDYDRSPESRYPDAILTSSAWTQAASAPPSPTKGRGTRDTLDPRLGNGHSRRGDGG
jgi:alpha/beta hydrolase fold